MCRQAVPYFVTRYVQLYNATTSTWLPFTLWPAQSSTLRRMEHSRLLVILKARQLGLSWLSLAYALWTLTFLAPATVLLFSLREAESVELLSRLRDMYRRLPPWMQARSVTQQSSTVMALSTGSRALAFSTRSGRSYTGTLALVDEADYIPDLATFLNGVKPTIDAGGKLFLVSTADKKRPISTFKNLFRAAKQQAVGSGYWAMGAEETSASAPHSLLTTAQSPSSAGDYEAVFLPWHAHPDRDQAWHDRTQAEMFAQRGTHDDFYAEYPETPEEALAPEQLDRRIPYDWLKLILDELPPANPIGSPVPLRDAEAQGETVMPPLMGLTVYVKPLPGHTYVIGADPAEGNPNSDDSAACVLDAADWSEVATLVGKFEPSAFALFLDSLSRYYHAADILVERNNHGHTVIAKLAETHTRVLPGYDGKPGWLSNIRGKPLLYDAVAEAVRDGVCRVRSPETASQLASIEASTLRAPEHLHDDRADAFALALTALARGHAALSPSTAIPPTDPLYGLDPLAW